MVAVAWIVSGINLGAVGVATNETVVTPGEAPVSHATVRCLLFRNTPEGLDFINRGVGSEAIM